jgi:hypothetical protein
MGNIGFIDTGTIGQITTVSSVTSTIGAAVVFPTTSTLGAAVTIPTSSTINNLYAGVSYTPVSKYVVYTSATALASVWIPASGKKWYMTDLIISASTVSDVTLVDTTNTLVTFTFGDNGGIVSNFRTPLVATSANGTLRIATSAGSVSFLASGWEVA